MWSGSREEGLNNMIKYEKRAFSHLLCAGDCLRCRWKITEEDMGLSYQLSKYGTIANAINSDFTQNIEIVSRKGEVRMIKILICTLM